MPKVDFTHLKLSGEMIERLKKVVEMEGAESLSQACHTGQIADVIEWHLFALVFNQRWMDLRDFLRDNRQLAIDLEMLGDDSHFWECHRDAIESLECLTE